MALGYEGWIKLGGKYVLGTGTSAPRTRPRLDSSSGYGGNIRLPEDEMGIGLPHNYDWVMWDGSVNFDVSYDVWSDVLWAWLWDRQSAKELVFSSRKENVQQFDEVFFNSISLSASEGGAVDGSVGFVSIQRDDYTFGSPYIDNKFGNLPDDGTGDQTPLCPLLAGFPPPLNKDAEQRNPVPYWNTRILAESSQWDFLSWSLDFSQPVERFFGCTDGASGTDPTPQEPLYLACGPMTVTLSGTIMQDVLVDSLTDMEIFLADKSIILKRLELQNTSDEVQTEGNLVVQNVEYEAFEIASA